MTTTETQSEIWCGDCREVMAAMPADSFDAVVTDPPYELGFMGKAWDRSGVAFDPATWAAVLRVLRPGGYMLAMGGTRAYHRLAVAVEDAGFELRDCLMWVYGTGFPKGAGCLKPAWEPILLARKPGPRVLPLGVDECRVGTEIVRTTGIRRGTGNSYQLASYTSPDGWEGGEHVGRYPANVAHDGSEEATAPLGDAARFFYCAKASKADRGDGNSHPTVKPQALMRWMVRLVCPAGGVVLDPFAGSGSTLVAARAEGRAAVGVELSPEYAEIAARRLDAAV